MQKLMRLFCLLAVISLPLFGGTRDKLTILKNDIERIVHHAEKGAVVGIDVVSVNTNERLYSRNHKQRFIPASLIKVLTLGAALDLLGMDYTYKTGIYTDGKIEDGVLHGNLYLKGSGDPSFVTSDLEHIVKQLHMIGIEEVKGSLVVDASAFDSTALAPGWMVEDTKFVSSAIPSALSVNQSCFDIWIRPASNASAPAVILSDLPSVDLPFLIDNQTLTLASIQDNKRLEITTDHKDRQSVIRIAGNLSLQSAPQLRRVPIKDPALMTGAIVKELFKRHQIVFRGTVQEGMTPVNALVLAEHSSDSLLSIGQKMCKESDNFFAHCMFKTLGKEIQGPPGSWQSGSQVLREFLANKVRLEPSDMVLLDGSGLSRYNLMTPTQIVEFLTWAHHNISIGSEFKTTLSIAGIDGTLKNRLALLQGKLRAKTGTMTGVSNLCGYVFTKDGEELAFTIMVNGSTKESTELREKLIDPICMELANFSRR